MAGLSFDFDGTVESVNSRLVSFRADEVRQGLSDKDLVPDPGGLVVVRYEEPPTPLKVGVGYRVKGWNPRLNELSSQIAYDFDGDCGTGEGTTALDGSLLGSPKGWDRWWPYAAAVVVLIVGVVALDALRAHRRGLPRRLI